MSCYNWDSSGGIIYRSYMQRPIFYEVVHKKGDIIGKRYRKKVVTSDVYPLYQHCDFPVQDCKLSGLWKQQLENKPKTKYRQKNCTHTLMTRINFASM